MATFYSLLLPVDHINHAPAAKPVKYWSSDFVNMNTICIVSTLKVKEPVSNIIFQT